MPEEEHGEEKEYNLERSLEELGALYPILVDAKGRLIDGVHRYQTDRNWPAYVLEYIDTDEKYLTARIVANTHRRTVPAEEKTKWLSELAEKTGWTPRQMADKLGMSYSWVMKYLPDECKERPGAGPSEYPVTRRVTQETEAASASLQPSLEAAASRSRALLKEAKRTDLTSPSEEEVQQPRFEPSAAEPERVEEPKPKTFKCRACMEEFEFGEPWRPVLVTLCPECEMQFQMWKVDKDIKAQKS